MLYFILLIGIAPLVINKIVMETPFYKGVKKALEKSGIAEFIGEETLKFLNLPRLTKNNLFVYAITALSIPFSNIVAYIHYRHNILLIFGLMMTPLFTLISTCFFAVGVFYQLTKDIFFILHFSFLRVRNSRLFGKKIHKRDKEKIHAMLKYLIKEICTLEFAFIRENPNRKKLLDTLYPKVDNPCPTLATLYSQVDDNPLVIIKEDEVSKRISCKKCFNNTEIPKNKEITLCFFCKEKKCMRCQSDLFEGRSNAFGKETKIFCCLKCGQRHKFSDNKNALIMLRKDNDGNKNNIHIKRSRS